MHGCRAGLMMSNQNPYGPSATVRFADGSYARVIVDLVGNDTALFYSKYSATGVLQIDHKEILLFTGISGSSLNAMLQSDSTVRIGYAGGEPHTSESGVAVINAAGTLVSSQTSRTTSFGPDSTTIITVNGVVVKEAQVASDAGTSSTKYFDPATGALVRSVDVDPVGTTTTTLYGIAHQPYTKQTSTVDAFGQTISLTRYYANGDTAFALTNNPDGSHSLVDYDPQGRVVDTTARAVDGSRVVIENTYTGSSTTPSLVRETDYSSANQKLAVDITRADGSHLQTAYAAGVTLTSATNAPDILSSASAGRDTFVFKPAFGQDIITNFHAGSGASHDVADFTAFHVQLGSSQSQADYLAQHLKQVGGDAVLTISPNEVLTLKNTIVASLTRDDVRV